MELRKKSRLNFFFKKHFDFIKFCSIGDVLTIHYFILFGEKKKFFIFTGILLSKKKNSFEVENCINSDIIKISFSYFSPSIVNIFKSDKYNFSFKKCKLNLEERLFLTAPAVDFTSDFSNISFDIPKLILNNFFGFFKVDSNYKKKFKKVKKKFRY